METGIAFTFTPDLVEGGEYFPPSGPTTGGTSLRIAASLSSVQCEQLFCIFGSTAVPATQSAVSVMASTSVECSSPPQPEAGDVDAFVQCDGKKIIQL